MSAIDSCIGHDIFMGLVSSHGQQFEREKPIAAKRVGLKQEKNPGMCNSHYRFLVMPKMKHVDKAGIEQAMRESGEYDESEISNIWG